MRRALIAGLLILQPIGAARAEEVGIVLNVVQLVEVRGFPPSGEPSWLLEKRNPIERGLKVKLVGPKAELAIGFTSNFGCWFKGDQRVSIGAFLAVRRESDVDFGDASAPCYPKVKVNRGRIRLASLVSDNQPEVETPHARIKEGGTVLRVAVDPVVGTFVAVDEGSVSVQAIDETKSSIGEPVVVGAGQWVLVPPNGLPTRPSPLPADDELLEDPLLPCCTVIEPPKPPAP